MRLNKLGFMPKGGFDLPTWLNTVPGLQEDVSRGIHLHEFTGVGNNFCRDSCLRIRARYRRRRVCRLDPTTHRWVTHKKDVKICSPGIRFLKPCGDAHNHMDCRFI